MSELSKLLSVLDELRHRAMRIAYVLVPLFGFFLGFEVLTKRVPGVPFPLPYPWPSPFHNVTAQVFIWLTANELPGNVTLLNLGVGDAVVIQMEIGGLLAIAIGMPWIVHEVAAFLMPALRQNERALLKSVGIPASILFAVGFIVALFWITPFTFLLLTKYVQAMGLAPVFSAQSFLEFALLYTIAFGIVFELPIFVFSLSRIGLIPATFWRRHWRGAVLGCFIFGMIITPDNSGITMCLIAIPMVALYFGGVLAAERHQKRVDRARVLSLPGGVA